MAAWLVRKLLTLDYGEVSFGRRRFRVDDRLRARLEAVPTRFLDGHHLAIETDDARELSKRIDEAVPVEFRGFAYEGAGMGLALLDLLGVRAGAPLRFMETAGRPHDYIISVGAGFAVARVLWARWAPRRVAERFPPGLSSLVINGYGFHEAFFRPELTVGRGVVPRRIDADMSRYFDNGVGRALWFVEGAHPARIGAAIRRFPAERQRHLWTGLGLACAYAGMAYADMIEYAGVLAALKSEAGPLVAHLALGSVLAAESQLKSNTGTPWLHVACNVVAGTTPERAANLAGESLQAAHRQLAGSAGRDATWRLHALAADCILETLSARRHAADAQFAEAL